MIVKAISTVMRIVMEPMLLCLRQVLVEVDSTTPAVMIPNVKEISTVTMIAMVLMLPISKPTSVEAASLIHAPSVWKEIGAVTSSLAISPEFTIILSL